MRCARAHRAGLDRAAARPPRRPARSTLTRPPAPRVRLVPAFTRLRRLTGIDCQPAQQPAGLAAQFGVSSPARDDQVIRGNASIPKLGVGRPLHRFEQRELRHPPGQLACGSCRGGVRNGRAVREVTVARLRPCTPMDASPGEVLPPRCNPGQEQPTPAQECSVRCRGVTVPRRVGRWPLQQVAVQRVFLGCSLGCQPELGRDRQPGG